MSIVNGLCIWDLMKMEVNILKPTNEQYAAVTYLHGLVHDLEVSMTTFAELDVRRVVDTISISLREVSNDFKYVVNGAWLRLAIEEDGYIVLTGSNFKVPVTSYPVTT